MRLPTSVSIVRVLSEQLADFVMKSLITDNKRRFTTAKDMLDALKAIGVDGLMKLKKGM